MKSLRKQIKRVLNRCAIDDKFTVHQGSNQRGTCVFLEPSGGIAYSPHLLAVDLVQAALLILVDNMRQVEAKPDRPDLIISVVWDTSAQCSMLSVERFTDAKETA